MSTPHAIHIPGHVGAKVAFLVFGLALTAIGFSVMVPDLRTLIVGKPAEARAVAVIKARPGQPESRLANDLDIRAAHEPADRTFHFWNVFRFQDADGREHEVRLPVASVLKPLYPLVDADGYPTVLRVHHVPGTDRIVFPTVFGTWVFPSLVTLIGLLVSGCAAVILLHARRPIELPVVHPGDLAGNGDSHS